MRACCVRRGAGGRGISRWEKPSPHEYRNDGTGVQAEGPVTKHTEDATNLATVRSNRDPGVVVRSEYLVQHSLRALVLRRARFCSDTVPELVLLREPSLNLIRWKEVMDVRSVTAMVAGMDRDAFSK